MSTTALASSPQSGTTLGRMSLSKFGSSFTHSMVHSGMVPVAPARRELYVHSKASIDAWEQDAVCIFAAQRAKDDIGARTWEEEDRR